MIPPVRSLALSAALLAAPALAAALGGCSSEAVDPVPATTTTSEPTAHPTTTVEPAVPRRAVSLRNPLGGPANNLLLDGDFELSAAYGGGQYGWRMFSLDGSEVAMTVETGALCRSGLTCVKLRKGQVMFGRGAAAQNDKGHVMGLWVRLPEGESCKKVAALAIECESVTVLKKAVPDEDFAPAGGWCHLSAAFDPSKTAICMYLQNTLDADQEAIVDAAVLGPNDGTIALKATQDEPLDTETLAQMARVRDRLRRTTHYGRPEIKAPPKN